MTENRYYSIKSNDNLLYVASSSDKALRDFIGMYFRNPLESISTDQIKEITRNQARQAPYFNDFERTTHHSENSSFCLGVFVKK